MKHTDSLTAIPSEIAARLAILAPCIAFSVSREIDENYRWDGDGPDPRENGFDAYDVTVTARTIVDGQIVEGENCLGGSYFQDDEPTGKIHGYLLQMLAEAVCDLRDSLSRSGNHTGQSKEQLNAALAYITDAMQKAYDAQRAGKV